MTKFIDQIVTIHVHACGVRTLIYNNISVIFINFVLFFLLFNKITNDYFTIVFKEL